MKSRSERMRGSFPTFTGPRRRGLAALCALALSLHGLLWTGGCRTTPPPRTQPPAVEPAPSPPAVERAPRWIGEPLSWEKLRAIESWLGDQDPAASSYWTIEGELQLNQGRVELAQREQGSERKASGSVQARVRTARGGLERVLANEDASAGQKKRAQDAIARADKLLKRGPTAVGFAVQVIPRGAWGAMPAHAERMDRNKGGWKRITVHHSADLHPPDLDGSQAASAAAVRSIQKAHIDGKETHYGDIGYHFVIDPYGRVFQGRDLVWQGAHAKGDNNIQNIGVCLIGNFEQEKPSPQALAALEDLLDNLRKQYSIARSRIIGHGDLKKTECPGRFLEPWVKRYAQGSS